MSNVIVMPDTTLKQPLDGAYTALRGYGVYVKSGPVFPSECSGADICINIGNDGTNYGFHTAIGYGSVTPPTFGGLAIYAIVFFDDGSGLCIASMGGGTDQLPGVTSLAFTWGTYGSVTYTWNAITLRYEAIDIGLVAYMKAELGNNVGGSAVSTNLITNPTFDVDVSGYTGNSITTATWDTSLFTNGGMKVEVIGSDAFPRVVNSVVSGLIIGEVYLLEADYYIPSTNYTKSAVLAIIDQPLNNSDSTQTELTDEIVHMIFEFTATTATQDIFFGVLKRGSSWGAPGDKVFVDNVSLRLN